MDWPFAIMAVLSIGLLCVAAWSDIAIRIIPDWVCAAVSVIGIAMRLFAGPYAVLTSTCIAAGMFLFLVLLHARGMLGGGDVKLAAAICLGLSPSSAYRFVFITAMAGGVLSVLHLIARRALRGAKPKAPPPRGSSLIKRVLCAERWRIARHGSLSYGVAIACGGIWAVLEGQGN